MSDSKCVGKEACPNCKENGGDNSNDNLAVFDDGHKYCFACGYYHPAAGGVPRTDAPLDWTPYSGKVTALSHRGISEETCSLFNYRRAKVKDQVVEIANYYRNGDLIAQKIRKPGKEFTIRGNGKNLPLFGMHLWREGGKRIVVTEGEIDALSVSQAQGNRWPVVSLPAGASAAAATFRNNLEYLNSYETVVICFDMDEPGQKAAEECAKILHPGKAKIASLPMKDANEMIVAGKEMLLKQCLWEAKTYRPDGIKHASEVDMTLEEFSDVWEYPWPVMTKNLLGRRGGELVMHASGSGMGKSTVMRELISYDLMEGEKVGVLMLEESCKDTLHDIMALILNKPVKRILTARALNRKLTEKGKQALDFGVLDDLDDKEYERAVQEIRNRGLYLYDHFGSLDCDTLLHKLDYLVTGLGCKKVILDHVSIVVSGMESGNERKDIDVLMTNLRQLVERTGCHLDAVCHLTKPPGKPFEEGGQISLRDFRGSGALYQLADACIGYERNQQHSDPAVANTIAVRSLKDRFSGRTGIVSALRYSAETGRLTEIPFDFDENGELVFGDKEVVKYSDMFTDVTQPNEEFPDV